MSEFFGDNPYRLLALLVFVSALLLVEGLYLLWKAYYGAEVRKLSSRLRALASDHARVAETRVVKDRAKDQLGSLEKWLADEPRTQQARQMLLQAGIGWTVMQLALVCVLAAIAGFALATAAFGPLPLYTSAAALLGGLLPLVYVHLRRAARLAKILRQLPDALDFITRALRAGHSFASALMMCGEELPEPIASEFRAVHDEITFGTSLERALTNLSERLPLTDIRYFTVAVLIQRDSGGNLVEVLNNLSTLIRSRYKLWAKVKTLSADGRFSALILIVMPFGLGALLHYFNPEFMSLLWTDPIGQMIVQTLAVLMLIGIAILHRIVKIRV